MEALNDRLIEVIGSGYQQAGNLSQDQLIWQGASFDFLNPIFYFLCY